MSWPKGGKARNPAQPQLIQLCSHQSSPTRREMRGAAPQQGLIYLKGFNLFPTKWREASFLLQFLWARGTAGKLRKCNIPVLIKGNNDQTATGERFLIFHCPTCHQPGEDPPSEVSPFPCPPRENKGRGRTPGLWGLHGSLPGGGETNETIEFTSLFQHDLLSCALPKSAQVCHFPNWENEMSQRGDDQDSAQKRLFAKPEATEELFPPHLPHQDTTVLSCSLKHSTTPKPQHDEPALSHENCHLLALSHLAGLLENSWKAPCSDWDALMTHLRLGKVLLDLENEVPKPLLAQCFVLLVGTNSSFLRIICTTFTRGEVGFELAWETCPEAIAATKKISERETLV